MNLILLRHTAKEILAVAILELFPTAQLIDGEVDEIGFTYTFLLPKMTFTERELQLLEDHMIHIVRQERPIKELEMMRENAAVYLQHLGQSARGEAALASPTNIVSLIEIGSFRDLCPGPYLATTKEVKAFKLHGFRAEGELVHVAGTAFFEKDALKAFLKKYKEATKKARFKEKYLVPYEGEWLFVGRGEKILQYLKQFWDQQHTEYTPLAFSDEIEKACAHEVARTQFKQKRLASFSLAKGDYVTHQCANEKELFEALISSLHFIEKAYKIFPFEWQIICFEQKAGWLSDACRQTGLPFESRRSAEVEAHLVFRVADEYGRERTLSYLKVERNKLVLHRSLFYSSHEWVAHVLERGDNFEFSY